MSPLPITQRASIVANAARIARDKLERDGGRVGDLQTLSRLIDVPAEALAVLYDEIGKAMGHD